MRCAYFSRGWGEADMAEEEIWEEGRNRKFNMLSLEGQLGIYLKAQERRKAFPLAKGSRIVVTEKAWHIYCTMSKE